MVTRVTLVTLVTDNDNSRGSSRLCGDWRYLFRFQGGRGERGREVEGERKRGRGGEREMRREGDKERVIEGGKESGRRRKEDRERVREGDKEMRERGREGLYFDRLQ